MWWTPSVQTTSARAECIFSCKPLRAAGVWRDSKHGVVCEEEENLGKEEEEDKNGKKQN